MIVVLDQFTRHIYRNRTHNSNDLSLQEQGNQIQVDDNFALSLTNEFINQLKWYRYVPIMYQIFSTMPLRHNKPTTLANLEFVLNMCEKYKTTNELNNKVLLKFEKQTIRRFEALKDKEKATNASSILENDFRQTDETNVYKEKLVQLVDKFLKQHVFTTTTTTTTDNNNDNNTNQSQQQVNCIERTLVVSLSGGVDSMVLCKILVLLANKYNAMHKQEGSNMYQQSQSKKRKINHHRHTTYKLNVVALHVNYNNRVESIDEANYLKVWCKNVHVELLINAFTDIKRGITPRDVYEKETRSRRYQFYKDVLSNQYNERNMQTSTPLVAKPRTNNGIIASGIFFGHHQGDVQENVISNTMKGSTLLGLSGMYACSTVNGVLIYRPLLPINKPLIIQFAKKYGVPYFLDTTPTWSNRGKMRNQLIPLCQDMFGSGVLSKLSQIAVQSNEISTVLNQTLFEKFKKRVSIVREKEIVSIDINSKNCSGSSMGAQEATDFVNMPLFFWRSMLSEVCHSQGWPMIGNKALNEMLIWFQRGKSSWIPVKKTMPTLYHNGILYMFNGALFFNHRDEASTGVGNAVAIQSNRMQQNKLPSIQQVLKYINQIKEKSIPEI